ncbi:MAG: membrane protein insertase YidC [Terriglobia bacterium]
MKMDNEKRLLIAFGLSFAFLIVWRMFLMPTPPPAPPPTALTKKPAAVISKAAPSATKPAPRRVALQVIQGKTPEDIVVENALYRITLSTQGAVVKSWILKKYQDERDKPLDIVNTGACAALGYPLSLDLADSTLAARLNSAVFAASPSGSSLQTPQTIEFTYSDGKIEVRKRISFGSSYDVKVEVSVFDGERNLPVAVQWPGGIGDHTLPFKTRDKESKAFYDQGNGTKTVSEGKVKSETLIPGPLRFAGLEDNFFAGVFLPGSPQDVFRYVRQSWTPLGWTEKQPRQPLVAFLGTPEPAPLAFNLFIAPKELNVLSAENPALTGLVDFGWFSFFAKPLFLAMRWFNNNWVHNWGWSIVILTILINMVFFPLKVKSLRSSQAMQKVSPLMKEIQARYKGYKMNDPRRQRMNQEIMKLYKEHGVNPLGGCLPMAAQLPIIYAFYEVLETSIAMRHSPWILWVKDLSVPDPLYILPVLAIVLSFLMQKMTPMPTADPAQQRMMMFAPLFVGFIFFYEAAGLTLYYFVYCAVAVLQQLLINRIWPPPPPGSATAPSARAQASGGRKPVAVKG